VSLPLVTRFGADPLLDLEVANKRYVDGSGGLTFARVVKLVDQTLNDDSTFQDDDELTIAVNANKTYFGLLLMQVATDSVADFKYNFVIPAGASGRRWSGFLSSALLTVTVAIDAGATGVQGSVGTDMIIVPFTLRVVGTAGFLTLEWAQLNQNPTNTTMQQGSSMILWESA